VSPTYEAQPRFARDLRRLTRAERLAFDAARRRLVAGLRERPPRFEPALRVKRVQGSPGIWEMTWAPDGRATFAYGPEVVAGEAHVIWRRIGDHSILADP
jgi:hypothetical protein